MTVQLVAEAHARSYDAAHANFMALLGYSDRALLPQIVEIDSSVTSTTYPFDGGNG